MLLAVDIGNTNVKFGVFDNGELTSKISIPTVRDLSAEGLSEVLADKFHGPTERAIVSSVVPEFNAAMTGFIRSRFGIDPRFVRNDDDLGLEIDYFPLEDAGSDRLVNAFAAVERYGAPAIVCGFGTALAIDVVTGERRLIGGLIAPGMNTLSTALKLTTSRLPEVVIEKPERVIQNTTVGSIQSGIVHGYFSLVEGLLAAIKREIDDTPKVIATGGFAEMIAEHTDVIDIVDRDLTLHGLQLLSDRLYSS